MTNGGYDENYVKIKLCKEMGWTEQEYFSNSIEFRTDLIYFLNTERYYLKVIAETNTGNNDYPPES